MKLHKLISRTVLATALLGATIGGTVVGINASANDKENLNYVASNDSTNPSGNNHTDSGSQADITSGLLELNAVPNLNFGNNDNAIQTNNTNLKLMNNGSNGKNISTSSNGNNDNLLKVTDYRKTQANDNQHGGWTLQASLGNFHNVNGDSSEYNASDQWKINLNNNSSFSSYNVNYIGNNYNRYNTSGQNDVGGNKDSNSAPSIKDNVSLNSNGQPANVMGTNNNYTNGHGSTNVTYNSNTTSLDAPHNVQPGKYSADMNWNLTATPDSDSNNVS